MKIFKLLVILVTMLILSSCGQSSNSSSNSGNSSNSNFSISKSPLTIDNAGTVPVFSGSATNSVIYVHNNTKSLITNISYSVKSNFERDNNTFTIGKNCSTIPANSFCPLSFTTPILDGRVIQGSALITASFSIPTSTSNNFSQIINYALVNNTNNQGLLFNSGTQISSFGNDSGFATIYAYGSGTNQLYSVTSIFSNKPGVTITQGNINDTNIQSNFVQAVEISASSMTTNTSEFTATLTATSVPATNVNQNKLANKTVISHIKNTQVTYNSTSAISITPVNTGAILNMGFVPLINSGTINPGGSIYIVNNGSNSATNISNSANSGISLTNQCSSSLSPGGSCTIAFSVPQSSGNDTITTTYSGGINNSDSTSQSIIWFNNIGAPLLSMSATPSMLSFDATGSESATITITNIGGYDLTNVTIANPTLLTNGSANSTISNLICAAGGTDLPIGQSCSYTVTVNDDNVNGDLNQSYLLQVNANYINESVTQNYSRLTILPFNVAPYIALINFSSSNTNWQIIGNNQQSATQTITMTNNGSAPAVIDTTQSSISSTSNVVSLNPNNFTNCATLAIGGSCTFIATLESTLATNEESGAVNINAIYSSTTVNNNTTNPITKIGSFPFKILPQGALAVTSVDVNNTNAGGNGLSSTTPYIFSGMIPTQQSITFTLQNTSPSDAITINRITDTNSLYAWAIDPSSTCSNGASIGASASCTLIYAWSLTTLAAEAANVGAVYIANLTLPTFMFQDNTTGLSFTGQPNLPTPYSGSTLYVKGKQATITNQASYIGGIFESLVITHVMANAQGYAPVTIKSNMEDYFGNNTPNLSNNCNQNIANGIRTQTCVLTPDNDGNATASGIYNADQSLTAKVESVTLHVLFSFESQNNQTIYMNPLSYMIQLIHIPNLGTLSILAGNGTKTYPQSGPAINSPLYAPTAIATDNFGNTYIADPLACVIEKVDIAGSLSIFAGHDCSIQTPLQSGIHVATQVYIDPGSIAVDSSGNVYFGDLYSQVVAKITPSGNLTIVAGIPSSEMESPTQGVSATQSAIGNPQGIAIDNNGNLYIANSMHHVIEKVDPQGILHIFAGNGNFGAPTDRNTAITSPLGGPQGVAVDNNGNVYIADQPNNLVEKVDIHGILHIFAGNGGGFLGDINPIPGPATQSPIHPFGIATDISGNVYIADPNTYVIAKVTPSGTLSIVAGAMANGQVLGTPGSPIPYLGLLSTNLFPLEGPIGVNVDSSGNLYIADNGANTTFVEKIVY